MSEYTVSGSFQTREGSQEFTRTIEAPNENVAREHTLSKFGAEHRLDRKQVEISEVSAE
jgi:large subunit ribosomal protein LX